MQNRESIRNRILIVAISRINKADASNNGMLLRNLFADWPKEHIAQIYSGDSNEDEGFFSDYYKLGVQDRRFGKLFFRLKPNVELKADSSKTNLSGKSKPLNFFKKLINQYLVKTGLYEIIFKLRVSKEMQDWVTKFNPDVIFAQGYNLTFIKLPILLKKNTNAKLAFLTTDDWPSYLYNGLLGESKLLSKIPRYYVDRGLLDLMEKVDIPFAFGWPMAKEYQKRYGKLFNVVSHCDNPKRFEKAKPIRIHNDNVISIITIGNFNRYRWPLLLDIDKVCGHMQREGIQIRLGVLSSAIDPEGMDQLKNSIFIDIIEDPGSNSLPCYLKGADILLLPEGFDENFVSAIQLSISSKAHLYMFSEKPIIVYAHENTGVAQYAMEYNWAKVITKRSTENLTNVIRDLLVDTNLREKLISNAKGLAIKMHNQLDVTSSFKSSLTK